MEVVTKKDVDVVIVGAGFAGLCALHKLRKQGFNAMIIDAGSSVGGTWYWNRYPGLRVDIESLEYSFSFSDELQQEWEWSERYASQAELLRYLNHVADRFDLRKDISLNTRVVSAIFDDATDKWTIETKGGNQIKARYCVMATGFLSAPNKPNFSGLDRYEGKQYFTTKWPDEKVDFSDKRVGVIGTGSSGVQVITEIGKEAEHLTVFQRTPSFCVPLRNCPLPPEYEKSVKSNYAEWRRREREESFGGWISVNYKPVRMVTKSALEVTAEERLALYEDRYQSGGLALYNVYPDVYTDMEANDTLAEFLRDKIRERVNDPDVAELLVPTGYPVLGKRLCGDSGYYETYNQGNVSLVDVRDESIEFTTKGILVKGVEYELDSVVFATGYDALSGALLRIDIQGSGGSKLKEHWKDGALTALGMMTAGFPNMFFLNGPGSPSPLYQPVLLCEEQSDWVGAWIMDMRNKGLTRIEPTERLEEEWVEHSTKVINATIFPKAASWYVGKNIPGKPSIGLAYFGGIIEYRKRCAEVLSSGFKGFKLSAARK
ncbi:MAG: NAD(P)/FAD-dependent oxidoreductase [Rhodobacteraceae bacterium]|nr:NAD(P)/FAD-dependent oxidoreductase [Paracoccaceae bacterium]